MPSRSELESVLSGMVQGVLVVDNNDQLISLNGAAARLLEVDRQEAIGKRYQDVITRRDLCAIIARAMSSVEPVEANIIISFEDDREDCDHWETVSERFFRLQDTRLYDEQGRRTGTMVLLQDVTRLRQLEVVRRDFVANVSHEIKTPITAVKAAVETVLVDASLLPEHDQRFLEIISRQADRLQAIVEDLLVLARLEEHSEDPSLDRESGFVIDVVMAAVDACHVQAVKCGIKVYVECDADIKLMMNRLLLEQAILNLLTNAIKYSADGSEVFVAVFCVDQEVCISVKDNGPGISEEHLPRIFERFYRTDKARSRDLGGTGLGLSIVKHIISAHGGRTSVDSVVGEGSGSDFRIYLPIYFSD